MFASRLTSGAWHALGRPALAVAVYSVVAAGATWPLIHDFRFRLAGDSLDPWQTLWGFWWWRSSGDFSATPFFSPLLWWPDGVSLWFQSWDLPSTLVASALAPWLSSISAYNLALFASFPLSGLTAYLLCRELNGGHLAPFLAGCLYTFTTYHYAHAQMQLHIASMQWSPLYFLGLVRLQRFGRDRDAVLAAIGASIATMASIYHLLFCVIGTVVLLAAGSIQPRAAITLKDRVRLTAVFTTVFGALTGWLLVGMANSYLTEVYLGGHDSVRFSADVQSFFAPNAVSTWSGKVRLWQQWTGNDWESSSYIGYVTLGLALFGLARRRYACGFAWLALCGAVLSLGPFLHVGGAISDGLTLPAGWLEKLLPSLAFSGLPVRFSWLTTFGLAVAAGAGLSQLCQAGRKSCALAVALTAVALCEAWPRPFVTTSWATPAILKELSNDPGDWAVLDATHPSQALWHQTLHRHPIVGGYVTRVPERLWDGVYENDLLRRLFATPTMGRSGPLDIVPQEACAHLQAMRVRLLIVHADQSDLPMRLGLAERYRGEDIVIYEVPTRAKCEAISTDDRRKVSWLPDRRTFMSGFSIYDYLRR